METLPQVPWFDSANGNFSEYHEKFAMHHLSNGLLKSCSAELLSRNMMIGKKNNKLRGMEDYIDGPK